MKKITLLLICSFAMSAYAQIENPVSWTYSSIKTADKQYELHITATIQSKWHVYSQDAGTGPASTNIVFLPNPIVTLEGKPAEIGKMETVYDPNFKSNLKYYANKVDFVQKIKLKSSATTIVKGTVSFMVCNDRKCLPPKEIPFSIKIASK